MFFSISIITMNIEAHDNDEENISMDRVSVTVAALCSAIHPMCSESAI